MANFNWRITMNFKDFLKEYAECTEIQDSEGIEGQEFAFWAKDLDTNCADVYITATYYPSDNYLCVSLDDDTYQSCGTFKEWDDGSFNCGYEDADNLIQWTIDYVANCFINCYS